MASPSKNQVKLTKSRGKLKADGPSRKKVRKLVVSDEDEDEDDYMEAEAVPEEDEDEDHVSSEEERQKSAKGKGKNSAGRGKKRKPKRDRVSSPQPTLDRLISSDVPSSKKVKPSLNLDDSLLEGDSASTPEFSAKTSPVATKPESPVPGTLKKLKLPAIKKNKPQGTTGTSTPTSATPVTKPRLPLDIVSSSGPKPSEIRKAQLGASDLDLSNKSIYQELFKTASTLLNFLRNWSLMILLRVWMVAFPERD